MDRALALAGLVAALAILVPFALYPGVLILLAPRRTAAAPKPPEAPPFLSLIVVVRNAASLIREKIQNCLALDYPRDRLELIFFSDGSTDETGEILLRHEASGIRALRSDRHEGKIHGLNAAISASTGEVVAFSDGDALLAPDALRRLAVHYGDPEVGGVSGRTTIGEEATGLGGAQSLYLRLNGLLKTLESRLGSVTAGEGKLYSVRRDLLVTIPEGVSDDFFAALAVIRSRKRFAFEPDAVARIRVPSRSPRHEVERRRRIVSQSLRSLWILRDVLDPLRHGGIAAGLFVNKVLRRLVPFALILLLPSCAVLARHEAWAAALLGIQVAFYAAAGARALRGRGGRGMLGRGGEVAYYVVLGQYGTLLGVVDFLSGRTVAKWDPVKSDSRPS